MSKPTPDYEIMFRGAVSALQDAYERYKKGLKEDLDCTFIANDGRLSYMVGKEERVERIDQAGMDVTRLMEEVGKLRRKVEL